MQDFLMTEIWGEPTTGQLIWIAHESIDHVPGHRHIIPIELETVDYSVAPVDNLSSIVQCDLIADGGSVFIVDVLIAVIIVEIIAARIG
jgi:hypothetical protein